MFNKIPGYFMDAVKHVGCSLQSPPNEMCKLIHCVAVLQRANSKTQITEVGDSLKPLNQNSSPRVLHSATATSPAPTPNPYLHSRKTRRQADIYCKHLHLLQSQTLTTNRVL